MQKIEVREVPSTDDKGDWYVFIDGKQEAHGFWSQAAADKAVDTYLWQQMPIG
jgi:hypothetical protein